MRDAVGRALARAHNCDGATVIEALTYRLSDHTTADDARHYRDDKEVSERWKEEPIARLRLHLTNLGAWNKESEERTLAECSAEIDKAVDAYLALPPPPPSAMFDHLYAALPAALEPQRLAVSSADVETHG